MIETPASILKQEYLKAKRDEAKAQYGTISNSERPLEEENYSEIRSQLNLFFSFVTQPIIYRPVVFILLYMSTPSYADPIFFFYTTVLQFSPITMGRLKLIYGIASVTGIFIYNRYLRSISFKKILWVTTMMSLSFNMLSILLVERINLKMGIPDFVFTIFTDAISVALAEINTMPLLVLACNICPKNIEGTLYAFLMSISNLGSLFSTQFGSKLSNILGITSTDFGNLSWLIFIANIVLIIPMPALYLVDESSYTSGCKNLEENKDVGKKCENNFDIIKLDNDTDLNHKSYFTQQNEVKNVDKPSKKDALNGSY